MKHTFVYILFSMSFFIPWTSVQAGGSTGKISVQSLVKYPTNDTFVEEIHEYDTRYTPLQIITFRMIIKNTSTIPLKNIAVTNKLPAWNRQKLVNVMTYPGTYSAQHESLSFTISDLAPGQTATYDIKAKIVHPVLLPAKLKRLHLEPGNVVSASIPGFIGTDQSSFYIENNAVK